MKKLWARLITSWQTSLLWAMACLIIIGLFTFHLGRLPGGFHAQEIATYRHAPSFSSLLREPINAPYFVVRNFLHKIGLHNSLLLTRGISVLVGLVAVSSFWGLMRRWYTPFVAGFASLSFAASNLVLRSSRLGLPIVWQLAPLIIFGFWVYLPHFRYQKTLIILLFGSVVSLVYVPGMVWLLIAGLIWQRRAIWALITSQRAWLKIVLLLVTISLLAPLVWGIAHTPQSLWAWLDISHPFSLRHTWQTFTHLPAIIALHNYAGPLFAAGQAPLLDVFSVGLVVIGLYSSAINWGLDRSKLALGLFLLATLRVTVGSSQSFIFLLIPLYLLFAEGLAYLLTTWLAVFPRNPLARATAMSLLSIAVMLAVYYQVANYFIAWPKAAATKTTFSQHL